MTGTELHGQLHGRGLGGAGTAGGLSTFCGLHANVHGDHRQVIHGLADDLLNRIAELDGLSDPHLSLGNRIQAQAFDISAYKVAADELVTGAGATLLYHAMVTGLSMAADNRIDAVFVESKSGRHATPGFEKSYIVDIAPQVGIRETRRILGEYLLSRDDILDCASFDDSIGVNGWPVEAHVTGDVEIIFPRGDNPRGFNQLPFRMIMPKVVDNLYVAGRCASMTHGGQSAARVSGPCFAMGQAAGTAADLALKSGLACRDVDYGQLRERLISDGAYLGEEW